MPNTGRQRWLVEATWGAATTEPESYTRKRLSAEGYALGDGDDVPAIDLSDAALVAVIFPDTIAASALSLKFKDAPVSNGTYVISQDVDGSDFAVTGVQDSKERSRTINAEMCTRFFVKPFFVDGSDVAVAPGAITVTFLVKE